MLKKYIALVFCLLVGLLSIMAQEPRVFKVLDFELNGPVKSCTVITNYGKEIFEFNEAGFLIKSTTQYNEEDKDITVYKYQNEELVEKRMESYKSTILDEATSMVNFYKIDTTKTKYIKELVVSFDKEFFEQQEYYYNSDGQLEKIIVSHEDAVDEVSIEYSQYKDELTERIYENGVIQSSERWSTKKLKNGDVLKIQLRKEFVDGEPNEAVETTMDEDGLKQHEQFFKFDTAENEFVPAEKRTYEYDKEGILNEVRFTIGNAKSTKNYIFQFDDSPYKNWVKKIITPDNSYITREIEYFKEEQNQTEDPN